jgi:hypothetical protein
MINSTLKMVRRAIATRYASTIAGLYAENMEPVNTANRSTLRALIGRVGSP